MASLPDQRAGGGRRSVDEARSRPETLAAGSSALEVVRVQLAFDTPGLVVDGAVILEPSPGDVILGGSCVYVSVPWDGSTPRLYWASAGVEASSGQIIFGPFNLADPPSYNDPGHRSAAAKDYESVNGGAIMLLDDTPVVAIIDDNQTPSGDPGSTQGEAEIVLLVART